MPTQPILIRQAAVVPVRNGQICLVSSRSGKRWVVPKGNVETGKTLGEVALQEAWEEAGVVGLLAPEPIGSYLYEKDGFLCHVIVFLMTVTDQLETYPEMGMRQRVWLSIPQAATRIEDAGLRDIVRGGVTSRAG